MPAPYAPQLRPQYWRGGFTTPPQLPPPARLLVLQRAAAAPDVTVTSPPAATTATAPAAMLAIGTVVAAGPGYTVTVTYDPLGLGILTLGWANTTGPLTIQLRSGAQPVFTRQNLVGTGQTPLPAGYTLDTLETYTSWSV